MKNYLWPSLLLSLGPLTLSGCFYQDSCVARGTLVHTPQGKRPIETLAVGDTVYSVNEATGAFIEAKILHIKSAMRACIAFCLPDGRRLKLTEDHIVYSPQKKEYLEAASWRLASAVSEVAVVVGSGHMVSSPVRVEENVGVFQVFDLMVDSQEHNFIANDVLVHNKTMIATCPSETTGETVRQGEECVCEDGEAGEYFCDYDYEGDRGNYGVCLCPPDWSDEAKEYALDCTFAEPVPCSDGLCCPEGRRFGIRAEVVGDPTCREPRDSELILCYSANTDRRHVLPESACYVLEEEDRVFMSDYLYRCKQFVDGTYKLQVCDDELEEAFLEERSQLPDCIDEDEGDGL